MPYSFPAHRRTHSATTHFTDERGPGAFVSLGSLPRRKSSPKKPPVFHFRNDDDDDDSEPEHIHSAPAFVPFPRSSPHSDDPPLPDPSLARARSSQIVLSNGKPLKSSLKSSLSTPEIPNDEIRAIHLRAQSAPSTPSIPHKNVHFAEKDGLATVRLFSRSARPAALSTPPVPGDDTETETDLEPIRNSYPFPCLPPTPTPTPLPVHIDTLTPNATSPIPATSPSPFANVHFESLTLSPPGTPPVLSGHLVVRNIAYEKTVAVRFTLDDWQTTSEVAARYVESLPALPAALSGSSLAGRTLGDAVGLIASSNSSPSSPPQTLTSQWDRFAFSIHLEDYAHKLHERVVWLVARYNAGGPTGGEWWDNNTGKNYRVAFRAAAPSSAARSTAQVQNAVGSRERDGREQQHHMPLPLSPSPSTPPTSTVVPPRPRAHSRTPSPPLAIPLHPPMPPPTHASPGSGMRLSKLNLLNYAAPAPIPAMLSPLSPPGTPGPTLGLVSGLQEVQSPLGEHGPGHERNHHRRVFPYTLIGGMPANSSSPPPPSLSPKSTSVAPVAVHAQQQKPSLSLPTLLMQPTLSSESVSPSTSALSSASTSLSSSPPQTPRAFSPSPSFSTLSPNVKPAPSPASTPTPVSVASPTSLPISSLARPSLSALAQHLPMHRSPAPSKSSSPSPHLPLHPSPPPRSALHWPWAPSSASPSHSVSGSGASSPAHSLDGTGIGGMPDTHALDRDSLYKAFVRQWCFAQSPPPGGAHGHTHGHSGGNPGASASASVRPGAGETAGSAHGGMLHDGGVLVG